MQRFLPLLLDIIAVAFVVLIVKMAARRGFVRTVVQLVGFVIALVAANYFAKLAANFVFKNYVRAGLVENITGQITQNPTVDSFVQGLESFLEKIPAYIKGALNFSGLDFSQSITSLPQSVQNMAESIVDTTVAPTCIALFSTVFFLLFFTGFRYLLRFAARAVTATIKNIPLVGTANTVLGGVVGVAQGLVYLYLAVMLLSLFMALTGDNIPFITRETIESTWLLSFFMKNNPLGSLFTLPPDGLKGLLGSVFGQ